ncbi:MAG TPA: gamma-glutamylcyclotransferase family protein [Hyphomicrobiaceae bacterium]|jgi:gamma-glutamylcyclotransferase (GGCT)/AIG2-like uncharacterized protein YtfP
MNSLLFVYGTLLSGIRHAMSARLRSAARLVGAATVQGRLYSLGRYPGLVEGPDRQYSVHGEVYRLSAPATSLQWLDAYEGIVPGRPDTNPYERVERPVRLASGEVVTAWVYLYRESVDMRPEVPDGRWVPPQI